MTSMSSLAHDPVVILAVHAAFALLFAAAARHKLRDRAAFAATLAAYRVLPAAATGAAGAGVAAVEAAIAVAWLLPGAGRIAAAGTIALLVAYGAAIALNLARGRRTIDCGCGIGGAPQPISAWLVARNACLAGAAWWTTVAGAGVRSSDAGRVIAANAAGAIPADGALGLASNAVHASAAYAAGVVSASAARPLHWLDALTLLGLLAVTTATWTAAHGLAAAAARVRAVDARHARRHGGAS